MTNWQGIAERLQRENEQLRQENEQLKAQLAKHKDLQPEQRAPRYQTKAL